MSDERAIDGVFNFRDLASASPAVRPGLVYRSDGLHRTDAAGADEIHSRGVRRVMDLRSFAEQADEGMFAHEGIETIGAPLVADSAEVGRQINDATDDPLFEHNRTVLRRSQPELSRALETIAQSIVTSRPIAFHCTAGKDRTGLLAALVLGLAGVDDEAIVDDYHASVEGVLAMRAWYEANRGETQAQKAAQMGIDPARMQHMMRADRSTMERTLESLRSDFGSFREFAVQAGVSGESVDAFGRLRS